MRTHPNRPGPTRDSTRLARYSAVTRTLPPSPSVRKPPCPTPASPPSRHPPAPVSSPASAPPSTPGARRCRTRWRSSPSGGGGAAGGRGRWDLAGVQVQTARGRAGGLAEGDSRPPGGRRGGGGAGGVGADALGGRAPRGRPRSRGAAAGRGGAGDAGTRPGLGAGPGGGPAAGTPGERPGPGARRGLGPATARPPGRLPLRPRPAAGRTGRPRRRDPAPPGPRPGAGTGGLRARGRARPRGPARGQRAARPRGRLVAIDPRPAWGDPDFDAVDWVLEGVSTHEALRERTALLADLVPGLDADRVHAWAHALGALLAAPAARAGHDDARTRFLLGLGG